MTVFTVHDGRLLRDGRALFPVGANYHPSAAGCDWWVRWDEASIAADLSAMAARGLNTVRIFLFWRDFEPREGDYAEAVFLRLRRFAELAGEHGLCCVPSVLTLWMNGQRLDPAWLRGCEPWLDARMRGRAVAYATRVARTLAGSGAVLAYDLGDELIHVDLAASGSLDAAGVRVWMEMLADAIRGEDPDALVFLANEASAVFGEHAFRPENTAVHGLVGLHGFPLWADVQAESWLSYRSTVLPGFLARYGARDAAVLVDEIGCYGGNEHTTARYLDASLHSAIANGAAGTLVWCWQDFTATGAPFQLRPQERFVGLLDAAGREKPALGVVRAFARTAARLAELRPAPALVGVLARPKSGGADGSYLRQRLDSPRAAFHAYTLLRRAHLPCDFAEAPAPAHRLFLCPSVQGLRQGDVDRLEAFARSGGHVYLSVGDALHGFPGEALTGVRVVDFILPRQCEHGFSHRGIRYPLRWSATGGAPPRLAVVEACGAEVLARFDDGAPALTRYVLGQGSVTCLSVPLEEQLHAPWRLEDAPWHALYCWLARHAGVEPPLRCDRPEVECAVLSGGGAQVGVLVNHGDAACRIEPVWCTDGGDRHLPPVELGPKEGRVVVLAGTLPGGPA